MPPPSSAGAVHPEPASGEAATGSAGVAADKLAGTDNLPTEDASPIPAKTGAPPTLAALTEEPAGQPAIPRPPKHAD